MNKKILISVIVLIMLIAGGLFWLNIKNQGEITIQPSEPVNEVNQEAENYYDLLEKKCAGNSCCLDSVKAMRKNNYKEADKNGKCLDGFEMNSLWCVTALKWCEPIEDQSETSNWKTYRDEKYELEFKYPKNLILNDYEEESLNKSYYGRWRNVVVLKNKKENYSIYFSIYTSDNYDLCKTQLYNEHDLNKVGKGEYKMVSAEGKLFLFNKNIELENIFKDSELNCIQSQCQQIRDLVIAVHLSATDLDDFVLRNSDDVIQQANQILSTFKFIEK